MELRVKIINYYKILHLYFFLLCCLVSILWANKVNSCCCTKTLAVHCLFLYTQTHTHKTQREIYTCKALNSGSIPLHPPPTFSAISSHCSHSLSLSNSCCCSELRSSHWPDADASVGPAGDMLLAKQKKKKLWQQRRRWVGAH